VGGAGAKGGGRIAGAREGYSMTRGITNYEMKNREFNPLGEKRVAIGGVSERWRRQGCVSTAGRGQLGGHAVYDYICKSGFKGKGIGGPCSKRNRRWLSCGENIWQIASSGGTRSELANFLKGLQRTWKEHYWLKGRGGR